MTIIKNEKINEHLKGLEGWELRDKEIHTNFKRKDFIDSIGFVSRIALLAERADHHPDILVQYNKVDITLSTHSEGGVTEKDIKLAGEIEEVK